MCKKHAPQNTSTPSKIAMSFQFFANRSPNQLRKKNRSLHQRRKQNNHPTWIEKIPRSGSKRTTKKDPSHTTNCAKHTRCKLFHGRILLPPAQKLLFYVTMAKEWWKNCGGGSLTKLFNFWKTWRQNTKQMIISKIISNIINDYLTSNQENYHHQISHEWRFMNKKGLWGEASEVGPKNTTRPSPLWSASWSPNPPSKMVEIMKPRDKKHL